MLVDMNLQQNLQKAFSAQQAGRLGEAAQLCRDMLARDPQQPEAMCLLGLAEIQLGNIERGRACVEEALRLRPDWPEALHNLGHALLNRQKLDEAADCFRRALKGKPGFVAAEYSLGIALHFQGKLDEAAASYRRVLQLKPEHFDAHNNLGVALQSKGQLDEAICSYRRLLELKPDYAEGHNNLGAVLRATGKLDEAIASFRRALQLKPGYAEAHNNLGAALRAQGGPDEAIACYRRALEAKPDYAEAYFNLGVALQHQGKLDEAIAAYRSSLERKPDGADAHYNLGAALHFQRKLDDAGAYYDTALKLRPDYPDAHHNRSMLSLLLGDFEHGWPEYEWRWQTAQLTEPDFLQPRWDGGALGSRTILLYVEQGFGDTMQFIRYASLVKKRNPLATVVVECEQQTVNLLSHCTGIDRLIGQGDDLPRFDVHSPLLSLPNILKTSLQTIPGDVPYVFAEPKLVSHWRNHLQELSGLRIGINWEGGAGQGEHLKRNIPLEYFAALAQQVPGIRLISLQKGVPAAELTRLGRPMPIVTLGPDFDTTHGAFVDTAAIMMNLDLVISSDTSIAHLAGSLGVPVWLALTYMSDWRWLLDRNDSPWYPTMRLFRQNQPGNWNTVFSEIAAALVHYDAVTRPTLQSRR
jgi:tetratricopeptide (TPR) repeat protein